MEITQGNPAIIARMRGESEEFFGLAGRGCTAPGCVVIRRLPHNEMHPYVVHFGNTQDGGYYFGNYCATMQEARSAARDKLERYDRHGELRMAFRAD